MSLYPSTTNLCGVGEVTSILYSPISLGRCLGVPSIMLPAPLLGLKHRMRTTSIGPSCIAYQEKLNGLFGFINFSQGTGNDCPLQIVLSFTWSLSSTLSALIHIICRVSFSSILSSCVLLSNSNFLLSPLFLPDGEVLLCRQ